MEREVSIQKDVDDLGVTAVQAYPPVWPPRFVIAAIHSESNSTVSIVFSGNTMPFATGFDAESIGKNSMANDNSEYPEWYRVVRGIDVSKKEKRDWFPELFGSLVLKGSPCFVRVQTWPKEDKDFKTLMDECKELSHDY